MADIEMKQNDRLPIVSAVLSDVRGAINLAGAAVKFIMRSHCGATAKVSAAATITDAATGSVSYTWALGDTDTSGDYLAEFEITFAGGSKCTCPNGGNLTVSILPDLG